MEKKERYRICIPPFINNKPLTYCIEEGYYDKVDRCDKFLPGCISVDDFSYYDAVLSSTYFTAMYDHIQRYQEIGICSTGPVLSVVLFSKKPLQEIRNIALATCSHSSVTLCQILFKETVSKDVVFSYEHPNLEKMLKKNDAALLIGDYCLKMLKNINTKKYLTIDIGEWWTKLTDLPFVWACWQHHNLSSELFEILLKSKTDSNHYFHQIKKISKRFFTNKFNVDNYFTDHLYYNVGLQEEKGIQLYKKLLHKHIDYLFLNNNTHISKNPASPAQKGVLLKLPSSM